MELTLDQSYIVGVHKEDKTKTEVILAQGYPGDQFVEVFEQIKNPDDYNDLRVQKGQICKSTMPFKHSHRDTLKESSRSWRLQ